jgi:hypothetical protein
MPWIYLFTRYGNGGEGWVAAVCVGEKVGHKPTGGKSLIEIKGKRAGEQPPLAVGNKSARPMGRARRTLSGRTEPPLHGEGEGQETIS